LLAAAALMLVAACPVFAQAGDSFFEREASLIRLSLLNDFLFMIPPLAWNAAFASRLSMEAFDGSAPKWYEGVEWVFRVGAMAYPILMPIDTGRDGFAPGLIVYSVGLGAYCASWIPFMMRPVPAWAKSPVFEFAPAYLPFLWLGGIALMSGSWAQAGLSVAFISLHVGEYAWRRKRG
jgi:hypothetical protein